MHESYLLNQIMMFSPHWWRCILLRERNSPTFAARESYLQNRKMDMRSSMLKIRKSRGGYWVYDSKHYEALFMLTPKQMEKSL